MRSGSRPSLNPAPSADQSDEIGAAARLFLANFRRPPRANAAEPIAEGGTAVGLSPSMAPWAGVLDEQELWDVVAYVRSLAKPPYACP